MPPLLKTSRLVDKTAKKRAADRHWEAVCRQVDARDGIHCRACKRKTVSTIAHVPERREHHHVIPKSLCGPDTVQNLCVICLGCHEERHVSRVLHITGNAEQALSFEKDGTTWNG